MSRWVAHEHGSIHLARRLRRMIYLVLQFPAKYSKCASCRQVEQSHATMSDVASQFVHPHPKVSAGDAVTYLRLRPTDRRVPPPVASPCFELSRCLEQSSRR